jgi:hypothetical protein
MDPSDEFAYRPKRRLAPTLIWGAGSIAAVALLVEVSRTGLDLLVLLLIVVVIVILERTVGDWLGEMLGSGLATLVLGALIGLGAWVLFDKGGLADMFFEAAQSRGYGTAWYHASAVTTAPAVTTIPPVASTGSTSAGAAAPRRSAVPSGGGSAAAPAQGKPGENGESQRDGDRTLWIFGRRARSEISLRVPTPVGSGERVQVRVRLSSNGAGVPGASIVFTVNMRPLGVSTTGSDGSATIDFSARLGGTYTIRADFLGDGRFAASSAAGTVTVIQERN